MDLEAILILNLLFTSSGVPLRAGSSKILRFFVFLGLKYRENNEKIKEIKFEEKNTKKKINKLKQNCGGGPKGRPHANFFK